MFSAATIHVLQTVEVTSTSHAMCCVTSLAADAAVAARLPSPLSLDSRHELLMTFSLPRGATQPSEAPRRVIMLPCDVLDFPEFWAHTVDMLRRAAEVRAFPRLFQRDEGAPFAALSAVTCKRLSLSAFNVALVLEVRDSDDSTCSSWDHAAEALLACWLPHRAALRAGRASNLPSRSLCTQAQLRQTHSTSTLFFADCVAAQWKVTWVPPSGVDRVRPGCSLGEIVCRVVMRVTTEDYTFAVAAAIHHFRGVRLLLNLPVEGGLLGETFAPIRGFSWSCVQTKEFLCAVGVVKLSNVTVTTVGEHHILAILEPRTHCAAFVAPKAISLDVFRVVSE